jgi:hypothetical protein
MNQNPVTSHPVEIPSLLRVYLQSLGWRKEPSEESVLLEDLIKSHRRQRQMILKSSITYRRQLKRFSWLPEIMRAWLRGE